MNSRGQSGRRRSYDNRLRQEQGRQTRARILEATIALAAEADTELTIATIAERAGVSEPTIYRHFGSRERLHEALDEHLRAHIGVPSPPDDIESLPAVAARLYRQFSQHAQLLRAALRSGLAREIRRGGKARRDRQMREAMAPHTRHLSAPHGRAVAAIYRVLIGWETWDRLTGELEIEGEAAADVVAWAVEAFNEKLERDRAAGRTTLRSDEES